MSAAEPGQTEGDCLSVIVVTGLPGSGKSTLATSLARSLRVPLLAMDPVKEALWDLLGSGAVEWSRQLGRAANEVVLDAAASAPAAVLDSFWRHEWALDRLAELPHDIIEVFCSCPPDDARARYAERNRHPAHLDGVRVDDPDLWAADRARPLFADALIVDTSDAVNLEALTDQVADHPRWGPAQPGPPSTVIVVTGLPGTGKTTIASALARQARCPVFGRDVIGAALARTEVAPAGDPDGVAFDLMDRLAEPQLRTGGSAIFDSVGGLPGTRRRWRALAENCGARLLVIECICSDTALHRERIEGRRRGIPGWYEVGWDDVEEVRARYEPWDGIQLVLDAADPADANIAAAIGELESLSSEPG